jgi:hypothetical protein
MPMVFKCSMRAVSGSHLKCAASMDLDTTRSSSQTEAAAPAYLRSLVARQLSNETTSTFFDDAQGNFWYAGISAAVKPR